jgi:hypothetical protein
MLTLPFTLIELIPRGQRPPVPSTPLLLRKSLTELLFLPAVTETGGPQPVQPVLGKLPSLLRTNVCPGAEANSKIALPDISSGCCTPFTLIIHFE